MRLQPTKPTPTDAQLRELVTFTRNISTRHEARFTECMHASGELADALYWNNQARIVRAYARLYPHPHTIGVHTSDDSTIKTPTDDDIYMQDQVVLIEIIRHVTDIATAELDDYNDILRHTINELDDDTYEVYSVERETRIREHENRIAELVIAKLWYWSDFGRRDLHEMVEIIKKKR